MDIDPVSSFPSPATLENLRQILAGKYFFLAALTLLLYDHLSTLPEEVETVWKKKKTLVLYLFILIRYYAPIAVSVVAFGFFSPTMTRERCANWMLFLPLGIVMPLTLLPGVLMLIRVYALYGRNKLVLFGLGSVLLSQTAAGLYQFTVKGGTPAPDPINNYEFHFCIYLPPKRIGQVATMYVFMEVGYDTLIFLLTISRTTYMYWSYHGTLAASKLGNGSTSLVTSLIRDGAFYFGAIFSMNLMWVLMIMHAPTGLRAIASIPSVTTVMISRITLNLRTTVYGRAHVFERTLHNIPLSDFKSVRRSKYSPFDPSDVRIHVQTEFDGPVGDSERELPFSNGNGFGDSLEVERKPSRTLENLDLRSTPTAGSSSSV
ncbi:hypothetical protein FA95DRAFT_1602540 [Auriscalpium vulgare]|uniref:Uncharacterized protein n=1 Tax=Auriscalpium vulgare TaxID=40419 RepID=A0ACB8S6I4_9AGAM|nr:hypothetical protein FA95DRAFT_1602540 [Auriscalpium vulgare]